MGVLALVRSKITVKTEAVRKIKLGRVNNSAFWQEGMICFIITVEVVIGDNFFGMQGTVKHLYRTSLFKTPF